MSQTGLLTGIVALALVAAWVLYPLILPPRQRKNEQLERQRTRLELYYERVLRNLRDLDEDHALGKIDEVVYQADRAYWLDRGAQALKALDALAESETTFVSASLDEDAAIDRAIDDAIEAAVRRAREDQPT